MHFAKDTMERSEVSQHGPWFAQNTPDTLEFLQCDPWSLGAARPVEFRRPRRRARPGKWLGRVQGLRGPGGGALLRRMQRRRVGTAETRGGGRWELCSGELAARAGQQASAGAIGGPSGGRSSTCGRCKRPERGARCAPSMAGRGGSGRSRMREKTGQLL
jgi:hypothetical protein